MNEDTIAYLKFLKHLNFWTQILGVVIVVELEQIVMNTGGFHWPW